MDKTTNHAELLTITKSWKVYSFQLFCTQEPILSPKICR
jgi:hypothetical protein